MDTELLFASFNKIYPLVQLFEVGGHYFAYDGKSTLITEISLDDIGNLIELNDSPGSQKLSAYAKLIKSGVFLPGPLKKITPEGNEIDAMIDWQFENVIPRKFTLEVTQDCNLRCKYCPFSDEENYRKHSKLAITEEIAFKAIDRYFEIYTTAIKDLTDEQREACCELAVPNLGWWGGEPFLNFDVIQKSLDYFKTRPWHTFGIKQSQLVFSAISNLTLLNDTITQFLVSNNIYLFVSFDGNEEQHNANRVFSNDIGTYDTVVYNLQKLITQYPEYCKERVVLQSVEADNIDAASAGNFIRHEFSDKVLLVKSYAQKHPKEYLPRPVLHHKTEFQDYKKIYENLQHVSEADLNTILRTDIKLTDFLDRILKIEDSLTFDNACGSNSLRYHFACPIGRDNIFCDVTGQFHICMKTDYSWPLGNVWDGLDKDAINNLYQKYYAKVNAQCCNCWAAQFCKICPASVMNQQLFYLPNFQECQIIKDLTYAQILSYLTLILQYPELFKKLTKHFQSREKKTFFNTEGPIFKNRQR